MRSAPAGSPQEDRLWTRREPSARSEQESRSGPGALGPEELAQVLDLPAPTPQQSRVITHPLTPVLVVAGAGSGKTATMTQRVVYLVARGQVRPDQVLGLTFTRKATAELAGRLSTRLEQLASRGLGAHGDDPEPTVTTYNAFAGSLVRDYGLRVGADPDSILVTDARAWQIASSLLEARTSPLPVERLASATRVLLRLDAALSENLLTVEQAAEQMEDLTGLLEGLAEVRGLKSALGEAASRGRDRLGMLEAVADYREYKRRHGLVSFGDQVALACRIAQESPEVVAQVRARFPAVVLDEFQDTSVAQIRLLSALFRDGGVTAVGDPNQAIYGWRGASAAALDSFHPAFNPEGWAKVQAGASPDQAAPVLPLSIAWRNDLAILDAANTVSAPLRAASNQPGDAQVSHVPVEPLSPRPGESAPGLVTAAYLSDSLAEAHAVADFMVQRWHPQAQLAVLARVRSAFPVIAEALEARGVPYQVVGLGGMLTLPEVADMRSVITVAADPERGDRLMRLLTGAGLGAGDLRALADSARFLARGGRGTPPDRGPGHAGGEPGEGARSPGSQPLLAEALEAVARRADAEGVVVPPPGMTPAGAQACDRVARAVRRVRAALSLPLPEVVEAAERALDLDIEVAARVANPLGARAVDAFRAAALSYVEDTQAPTVAGFLQWLDVAQEEEDGLEAPQTDPQPGAVQVLTIHASKGLEWDCVAVVGMSEGTFPGYAARPQEDLSVAEWSWMTRVGELPYPLRADAATLPPFDLAAYDSSAVGKEEVEEVKEALLRYRLALGRHTLAEERRLAYVALTRARHDILLTGSHLSGRSRTPRPRSRYLAELVRRDLVTPYGEGLTEADPQAVNPLLERVVTAPWPQTHPEDPVARARRAAAQAVRQAGSTRPGALVAQAPASSSSRRVFPSVGDAAAQAEDRVGEDPVVTRWWQEARLLLAERDQVAGAPPGVRLPAHLAATSLDRLRHEPETFALDLRRPLPAQPQAAGRLGTVFHEMVSRQLAARGSLLSLEEVGAPRTLSDEDRVQVERWLATVQELPLLEGYVLAASEAALELTVAGTTLRCRIDAVFRRSTGPEWLVVDWKTGSRRVAADQLSVYVHAWAQSQGVSVERVRAAYVYVQDGSVEELAAADLLGLDQIAAALSLGDGEPGGGQAG
ncbi:ATP-dependent helicase [Actinomyces sp. 2119]|nr:ATP-dependent helicase [Actinomyces sp. 2119]